MRCRLDRPVAARLHGSLPPPLPRPCPWAASMARRLAGSGDPRDRGAPYPPRQCARPTQQDRRRRPGGLSFRPGGVDRRHPVSNVQVAGGQRGDVLVREPRDLTQRARPGGGRSNRLSSRAMAGSAGPSRPAPPNEAGAAERRPARSRATGRSPHCVCVVLYIGRCHGRSLTQLRPPVRSSKPRATAPSALDTW